MATNNYNLQTIFAPPATTSTGSGFKLLTTADGGQQQQQAQSGTEGDWPAQGAVDGSDVIGGDDSAATAQYVLSQQQVAVAPQQLQQGGGRPYGNQGGGRGGRKQNRGQHNAAYMQQMQYGMQPQMYNMQYNPYAQQAGYGYMPQMGAGNYGYGGMPQIPYNQYPPQVPMPYGSYYPPQMGGYMAGYGAQPQPYVPQQGQRGGYGGPQQAMQGGGVLPPQQQQRMQGQQMPMGVMQPMAPQPGQQMYGMQIPQQQQQGVPQQLKVQQQQPGQVGGLQQQQPGQQQDRARKATQGQQQQQQGARAPGANNGQQQQQSGKKDGQQQYNAFGAYGNSAPLLSSDDAPANASDASAAITQGTGALTLSPSLTAADSKPAKSQHLDPSSDPILTTSASQTTSFGGNRAPQNGPAATNQTSTGQASLFSAFAGGLSGPGTLIVDDLGEAKAKAAQQSQAQEQPTHSATIAAPTAAANVEETTTANAIAADAKPTKSKRAEKAEKRSAAAAATPIMTTIPIAKESTKWADATEESPSPVAVDKKSAEEVKPPAEVKVTAPKKSIPIAALPTTSTWGKPGALAEVKKANELKKPAEEPKKVEEPKKEAAPATAASVEKDEKPATAPAAAAAAKPAESKPAAAVTTSPATTTAHTAAPAIPVVRKTWNLSAIQQKPVEPTPAAIAEKKSDEKVSDKAAAKPAVAASVAAPAAAAKPASAKPKPVAAETSKPIVPPGTKTWNLAAVAAPSIQPVSSKPESARSHDQPKSSGQKDWKKPAPASAVKFSMPAHKQVPKIPQEPLEEGWEAVKKR